MKPEGRVLWDEVAAVWEGEGRSSFQGDPPQVLGLNNLTSGYSGAVNQGGET